MPADAIAMGTAAPVRRRVERCTTAGVPVELIVYRGAVPNGPVTVVGLHGCMPAGGQYTFRQHVASAAVVAVIEDWIDSLPPDYCGGWRTCPDQIDEQWKRLCYRLARVPCIGSWADVIAVEGVGDGE